MNKTLFCESSHHNGAEEPIGCSGIFSDSDHAFDRPVDRFAVFDRQLFQPFKLVGTKLGIIPESVSFQENPPQVADVVFHFRDCVHGCRFGRSHCKFSVESADDTRRHGDGHVETCRRRNATVA